VYEGRRRTWEKSRIVNEKIKRSREEQRTD